MLSVGHSVVGPLAPVEPLADLRSDLPELKVTGRAGKRAEHSVIADEEVTQVTLDLDVSPDRGFELHTRPPRPSKATSRKAGRSTLA